MVLMYVFFYLIDFDIVGLLKIVIKKIFEMQ